MGDTLNSRSRSILNRLLEAREPLPVSTIADTLKVTARMVRYQLEDVENWLEKRGAVLERRPGKGIWIEYINATKASLEAELAKPEEYENKLSENERLRLMRLSFLAEARAQTSQKLGDYLGVSKTTVAKDLKRVREWFLERGLFLKGTPGVGLNLVGDEISWRKAMADAISEGSDEQDFLRAMQQSKTLSDLPSSFIGGVLHALSDVDLHAVNDVVDKAEELLGMCFTDASRMSLVMHLAIAIKRLGVGRDVRMPPSQMEYLSNKKEYVTVQRLGRMIAHQFGVRVPETEIAYLSMHILGAKSRDPKSIERFERDPDLPGFNPVDVARKIVKSAEEYLGQQFCDDELISGLATHLTPVFYRLRFGLPIRNPLLEEIKTKHSRVFEAARAGQDQFLLTSGMRLPEEEIGFVAMHLGAAIERGREQQGRPKVFVVCATGLSSASMLASRLRAEFPELDIARSMSVAEVQANSDHADLVVSTVSVDGIDIPVVVVNPLLSEDDIDRVRIAAYTNRLINRDRSTTRVRVLPKKRVSHHAKRFAEVLRPDSIKTGVVAKDWEDAIRLAGQLMLDAGACTAEYVDKMVQMVKHFGPYIVVAPSVAIPHAPAQDGALKLAAGVVRLKTAVEFGHPDNDPVSIVIALAIPAKDAALGLLEDLTLLLLDRSTREAMHSARSSEEIAAVFLPERFEF